MTTVYLMTTESGERSVHTFASTAHLRAFKLGEAYEVEPIALDPDHDKRPRIDLVELADRQG